jgi:3D (Asp-Asp-Asp) domain-containing protein
MNDEKRSAYAVIWVFMCAVIFVLILTIMGIKGCVADNETAQRLELENAELVSQIEQFESDKTYLATKVGDFMERMNDVGLPIEPLTREEEMAAGSCATVEEMIEYGYLEFGGNYKLTWYTSESEKIGTIGASGETLISGISVAIDPSIIPYGTDLYIPGYGWFIAHDTGLAPMSGHVIDVYYETTSDVPEDFRKHGVDYRPVWVKGEVK